MWPDCSVCVFAASSTDEALHFSSEIRRERRKRGGSGAELQIIVEVDRARMNVSKVASVDTIKYRTVRVGNFTKKTC